MNTSNEYTAFRTDSDASVDAWIKSNQIQTLDTAYVWIKVWGFLPWPILMYVGTLRPLNQEETPLFI